MFDATIAAINDGVKGLLKERVYRIQRALQAKSIDLLEIMKGYAPIDTGQLKDSFRAVVEVDGSSVQMKFLVPNQLIHTEKKGINAVMLGTILNIGVIRGKLLRRRADSEYISAGQPTKDWVLKAEKHIMKEMFGIIKGIR